MTMNEVQEKTNEYVQIALMASQYFQSNPEALRRVAEKLAEHAVKNQQVVFRTVEYDASMFGITDPIGQITGIISQIMHDVAASVANAISGVVNGIKSAIQGAVDWLKRAVDTITSLAKEVVNAAKSIGAQIAKTISDVINNIRSALEKGFTYVARMVVSAVSGLFGTLKNMISGAVDTLNEVYKFVSKVAGTLSSLPGLVYEKVKEAIEFISKGISDLVEKVKGIASSIGAILARIPKGLGDLINDIASTIKEIMDKVKGVASSIGEILARIPKDLSDFIKNLPRTIEDIVGKVKGAIDTVLSFLGSIKQSISDIISKVTDKISSIGSKIGEVVSNIKSFVDDLIDKIKNLGGTISNMIKNVVSGIVDRVVSAVKTVVSSAGSAVATATKLASEAGSAITKTVSGIAQQVANTAGQVVKVVYVTVSNAGKAIGGALEAGARTVTGVARTVANAVYSGLQTAGHAISSAVSGAYNTITKLPQYVSDLASKISSAVTQGIGNVVNTIKNALSPVTKTIQGIISQFTENLNKMVQFMRDVSDFMYKGATSLPSTASKALSGAVNWLQQVGSAIWGGLQTAGGIVWGGLQSAYRWLMNVLSPAFGAWNSFTNWLGKVTANTNVVPTAIELPQSKALFESFYKKFEKEKAKSDILFQQAGDLGYIMNNTRYGYEVLLRGVKDIKSYVDLFRPALMVDLGQYMRDDIRRALFDTNAVRNETRWYTQQIKDHVIGLSQLLSDSSNKIDRVLSQNDVVVERLNNGQMILHDLRTGTERLIRGTGELELISKAMIPSQLLQLNEKYRGIIMSTNEIKQYVSDYLKEVGSKVEGLKDVLSQIQEERLALETIRQNFEEMQKSLPDYFKQSDLKERMSMVQTTISNQGTVLGSIFSAINNISNMITGGINSILSGIQNIGEYIWNALPDFIKDFFDNINKLIKDALDFVSDAAGSVVSFLQDLWDKLPDAVKDFINNVANIVNSLGSAVESIGKALSSAPTNISIINVSATLDLAEALGTTIYAALSTVYNVLTNSVSFLKNLVDNTITTISSVLGQMYTNLKTASSVFAGLMSGILNALGGMIYNAFTTVIGIIGNIIDSVSSNIKSFVKGFLNKNVTNKDKIDLAAKGLGKSGDTDFINYLRYVKKVGPFSLVTSAALNTAYNFIANTFEIIVPLAILSTFDTLTIRQAIDAATGVGLDPLMVRMKIVEAMETIKLGELVKPFRDFIFNVLVASAFSYLNVLTHTVLRGYETYFLLRNRAEYEGLINDEVAKILDSVHLDKDIRIPFGSLTESDAKRFSLFMLISNAPAGVTEYTGLYSAIGKASKSLATFYYIMGKPLNFVEWALDYKNAVITFTDRFGATRVWPIHPLFELPTHSELLRMTQRDVLPNVQTMIKLGLLRGWAPDVTRALYMMTFKYPSFEKLWKFYMRATAGMLWFNPPTEIQKMFTNEANALGAGAPITPYQIQQKLSANPGAMNAFEMALNTYFKWIEYSNFSWFTKDTTINNVPIGSHIHGALGGWTADSWIMADVAADIPGKVDFRWMSRFGIFMWLAEKLGDIKGYTPLVDVIPKLLEGSPSSTISVDLSWFSKFLQGTGLHPAWVPLTTVAENIMVISDEMTLLRTGWLNLYRYGFVDPDFVEKALSGLFTVSYRVGFWDPNTKAWTTGWINLPVRWLPHERKLLELRMAIDRVVDLYRSFMGVMRRAIQYKAIKTECEEGSTNDICYYYQQMYSTLKQLFEEDTNKILGQALELPIDQTYFDYMKKIVELEGDIAINIEKKLWWFRLSGWLLYYGARGYITADDLKNLVDRVKDKFALSDEEAEAYKDLAESLNSVIIRTQIPTPNEIATIAEFWPDVKDYTITIMDDNGNETKYNIIEFILKMRGIPDYLWDFWKKIIDLKPLKNDVDRLFTQVIHAYQYDYIMQAMADNVENFIKNYGYTDLEINIGKMTGYFMRAHREITRYIPTPTHFATIAEIVPEVLDENWSKYEENITVYTFDDNGNLTQTQVSISSTLMDDVLNNSFMPSKWIEVWKKYIQRRPYADDVRRVVTALLEIGYSMPAFFDVLKQYFFDTAGGESQTSLKDYGYDQKELDILTTYKDLRLLLTSFTRGVNTYSELARIAEVVPEVFTTTYSEKIILNIFGNETEIDISGSPISDVIDSLKLPEEWKNILKKYVYRAPLRDEVRRYVNEVIAAVYSSAVPIDQLDDFISTISNAGYSDNEQTILKVVAKLHKARREWTALGASLAELASIAELEPDVLTKTIKTTIKFPAISITQNQDGSITISEATVQEQFSGTYLDLWLRPKYVPQDWVDIIKDYLYRRTIRDEVRRAVTSILTAYQFSITTDTWFSTVFGNIATFGYDSNEQALLKFSGEIRRMDREWRIVAPSVNELAVIAEYVPEMFDTYEFTWKLPTLTVKKNGAGQYSVELGFMEQKFSGSMVDFFLNMTYMPSQWIDILKKYIYRRQFRDEVARLVRAAMSAVRYGVPEDWISQYVPDLSNYGISPEELDLIDKAAHIEYYADIMRYVKSRVVADSVPRITLLASMAQYVDVPETLIDRAIDYEIVGKLGTGDFIDLLKKYIKVRPIKPEARRVLSAMVQALRYGIVTQDQLNSFVNNLTNYGFTADEVSLVKRWADLEAQIAEVRQLRMEYMPNPRAIATLAEYISIPENLVEESFRRYNVPDEWKNLWLQYIKVRPVADEVRRLITAAITAYAYGAINADELNSVLNTAKSYGWTDQEIGILKQVAELRRKYVETRMEAREYVPTPLTLANIAEVLPEAVNYLQAVLVCRNVPSEFAPLWSKYVQVKPIANDVNSLATAYFRAKARGVNLGDLENTILNILRQYGWTDRELQIRDLVVKINQLVEASREYIPTPAQLATIAEYVPSVVTMAQQVFNARNVPAEWRSIWMKYIQIRPVANEIRSLVTSAITAYAYNAITKDELSQIFNSIKAYGYTDQEITVLQQIADLRRKYVEARLEMREYIPTPITIATMAEYLPEAVNYLNQVFEARNVPEEWRPLWQKYVQVRPVYNDVNRIATAYFRALARGISLGDLENTILSILKQYGWTDQEIELRKLAAQIEEIIYESREYIPTPSQLASIAEVVPEARQLLPLVLQARRVPKAFAEIWQRYVDLRPLQNEVNRLVTAMMLVYEHFMIDKDTLQQMLKSLQQFGLEDLEIQLLVQAATLRRHTRMYDELIGTPRSLVSMAEYSPTARNLALAKVHAMIDELPIDDQTKQLLKTMWDEYIRIRPVYDEVRRYVTELINDYANGVIDDNTLVQELNDLKQWGLDDYEIQFYIWLAQKRRLRVLATRGY